MLFVCISTSVCVACVYGHTCIYFSWYFLVVAMLMCVGFQFGKTKWFSAQLSCSTKATTTTYRNSGPPQKVPKMLCS